MERRPVGGQVAADSASGSHKLCKACNVNPVDAVLVPCGCMAICSSCHASEYLRARVARDIFNAAQRNGSLMKPTAPTGGVGFLSAGYSDSDAAGSASIHARQWYFTRCPACKAVIDDEGSRIAAAAPASTSASSSSTTRGGQPGSASTGFALEDGSMTPGTTLVGRGGLIPTTDTATLALYGLLVDGQTGEVRKRDPLPEGADGDAEWTAQHGPGVLVSVACKGKWLVYSNVNSGNLYFVSSAGQRTWDMPREVEVEEAKAAKAGAVDEYAYEGLGADWEEAGPWVPPTVERALEYREREVYAGGKAGCCSTRDEDLAQLGVGVSLYFQILKSFSALFFALSLLSIPSMYIYVQGSRVPGNVPDPLKIARASLGNVGPVSWEVVQTVQAARQAAVAAAAGNASSSSDSSLADTAAWLEDFEYLAFPRPPGVPGWMGWQDWQLDGTVVAYIITAFDLLICLVVLFTAAGLKDKVNAAAAYSERKKVSAADYTLYVRGLPPTATVEEVRDHFSALFALDGTGVNTSGSLPVLSVTAAASRSAAAPASAPITAVATSSKATLPAPSPRTSTAGASSEGQPVDVTAAVPAGAEEAPTPRPELLALSTRSVPPPSGTGTFSGGSKSSLPASSSGARTGVPMTSAGAVALRPLVDPEQVLATTSTFPSSNIKWLKGAADTAKRSKDRRRKQGIMTDADADCSFTPRPEVLAVGTVQDAGYAGGDATFLGSWVASIYIVRPMSTTIRAYLSAQALTLRLREARATAKMYRPDTSLLGGRGADPKAHAKAMEEVMKLGAQLSTLRDRLNRRSAAMAQSTGQRAEERCAGGAFVTFNCEESYQRALKAYSSSSSGFMRLFQPGYLRFRHPTAPGLHLPPEQAPQAALPKSPGTRRTLSLQAAAASVKVGPQLTEAGKVDHARWKKDKWSNAGAGYRLWVEAAPDPSDVVHENLEVTSESRCLRQTFTSLISLLLVIAGLIVMVVAQGYSSTLAASRPDLTLCGEELPALYLSGRRGQAPQNGYAVLASMQRAVTAGHGGKFGGPRTLQQQLDMDAYSTAPALRGQQPFAPLYTPQEQYRLYGQVLGRHEEEGGGGDREGAAWRALQSSSGGTDTVTAALATPELTRLTTKDGRTGEDGRCASGSFSLAYRYDFSAVPAGSRGSYPGLTMPASPPASGSVGATFGTVVQYGDLPNNPASCSLTSVRSAVAAVSPAVHSIPEDPACPDPRALQGGALGYCPCASPTSTGKCRTLPCFNASWGDTKRTCRTFPSSTIAGCYCSAALTTYMDAKGAFEGFLAYADAEGDMCGDFVGAYVFAQMLIILSGLAATVVNVMLAVVMPALTSLEGHVSLSARSMAQSTKLAIAQSINTALTVLLVNARLPPSSGAQLPSVISQIGLLNGLHFDFSTPWYGAVGTTIVTTALSNTLIPPVTMSIEYFSDALTRCRVLNTPGAVKTQASMDELFVGARFNVAARYPLIITMTTVCLLYSTGLPFLLPLASIAFILQYAVDKGMLLCFYRKPPAYDASLPRLTVSLLPYIIVAHTGFALWMLSTPDLLPSAMLDARVIKSVLTAVNAGGSWGDDAATLFEAYRKEAGQYDAIGLLPRILRLNTFPIFVLFIILFVSLLLANVLGALARGVYLLAKGVSCGFICCRACAKDQSAQLMVAGKGKGSMARIHVGEQVDAMLSPSGRLAAHMADVRALTGRLLARGLANTSTRAGMLYEALFLRWLRSLAAAGLLGKGVVIGIDGSTSGRGKGLSPFTGEFSRLHDKVAAGRVLAPSEVAQGWRLQQVDAATQEDVNGAQAATERAVLLLASVKGLLPKGMTVSPSNTISGAGLTSTGQPDLAHITFASLRVHAGRYLRALLGLDHAAGVGAGEGGQVGEAGQAAVDMSTLGGPAPSPGASSATSEGPVSPEGTEAGAMDSAAPDGSDGTAGPAPPLEPAVGAPPTAPEPAAPDAPPAKEPEPACCAPGGCCGRRRAAPPLLFILRKVWTSSGGGGGGGHRQGGGGATTPALSPSTPGSVGTAVSRGSLFGASSRGTVASSSHSAGQAKRTWEVIADAGLASYDLLKNPVYKTAFLASQEEVDEAEDSEEEEEESDEDSPVKPARKGGKEEQHSRSSSSGGHGGGAMEQIGDALQDGVDATVLATAAATGAIQAAAAASIAGGGGM